LRSARLSTISFKNSTKTPKHLEILGHGKLTKSYLYITDCIEAMFMELERTRNQFETYNVGSEDQTTVKTIAETVIKEMKLKNVKLKLTGGVDGGRDWKGDVKTCSSTSASSNH